MVHSGILFLAITFALVFNTNARDSEHFNKAVEVFFPHKFQSILNNPQVVGVISTDMQKIPYETNTNMTEVCETLVKDEISQARGIEGEEESVYMLPATAENVKYWDMSKILLKEGLEAGLKPSFYVICKRPSTIFRPINVAVFCRMVMRDAWGYYGGDGNLQIDCWGSKAVLSKNPDLLLMDYDKLFPASSEIDEIPEHVDHISQLGFYKSPPRQKKLFRSSHIRKSDYCKDHNGPGMISQDKREIQYNEMGCSDDNSQEVKSQNCFHGSNCLNRASWSNM